MKILSLDFGGTSIKYAVNEKDGEILESGKAPAPLSSKEHFVTAVKSIYAKYEKDVSGLAVSIPGYVNPQTGVLIGSGAYRSLYGSNIIALLNEDIPVNIAVENDGKCGALAEAWTGALSDCDDGVVLILGSGVAGGIIKDKRIHAGNNLTAGEFSNWLVDPGNPSFMGLAVMNCAAFGITYKLCKTKNLDFDCQDYSAELKGIDSMFGANYPAFSEPPKKIKADGKKLYEWLAQKDPVAEKIYDEFIRSLAFLIFNVQITYAPQRIIIGGGLSRIPCLPEDVQKMLDSYYAGTGIGHELHASIELSKYLDECNLIGAAANYFIRYPE